MPVIVKIFYVNIIIVIPILYIRIIEIGLYSNNTVDQTENVMNSVFAKETLSKC